MEQWLVEYRKAACALDNRKEELRKAAELIEGSGLIICGASAIEDKLQVGVADTIATMHKAGIKLWVLTGDKMDTAITIGYSCAVLVHSKEATETEPAVRGTHVLRMSMNPKKDDEWNKRMLAQRLIKIVQQIRQAWPTPSPTPSTTPRPRLAH